MSTTFGKKKTPPKLTVKGKETYDLAWSKFESVKDTKMRDITTAAIQPLVDSKIAKGRSRSTQEKIRSMCSLLCRRAEASNIIAIFLYTGFRLQDLLDMPMSGVDTQRCVFVGEEKPKAGKNRVVPILSVIRPFVEYFYERATEALFLSGYAWHINGNNFRRRDYYPTFSKILEHADFDATSDIYIQADLSKLHQEMSKLASCED